MVGDVPGLASLGPLFSPVTTMEKTKAGNMSTVRNNIFRWEKGKTRKDKI